MDGTFRRLIAKSVICAVIEDGRGRYTKWKVASVDFMCIVRCGRLTLEINLIVFPIAVLLKIPSLLQFRKTVKRLVMCSLSTEKHGVDSSFPLNPCRIDCFGEGS